MLKEPHPGRVKTRLGADIGMVPAAWWFRHQTRELIRRMRNPRWDLVLAVSPDREGLESRIWPRDLPRWPQGTGNLGCRMARMMRYARGPVCVIGGDVPAIEPHHVVQAFAQLARHDAVIGPAPDGGYWLIGVNRVCSGLFNDVRWSTEYAMADTVASMGDVRIAKAAVLQDVDEVSDLVAMKR